MQKQIASLGRDALIYGTGSMILRFMTVLLTPLYTARLTPRDYGALAMLGLLTMVVQPVFGLGLSASMGPLYFGDGDSANKSRVVWTVFAIHGVCAVALMFVAKTMPVQIGAAVRLPSQDASLVQMTLVSCAMSIMTTAWMQRVQFEKQVKLYVAVTTATALLSIIVSMIAVIFLGWGAAGIVLGQLVGGAAALIGFMLVGVGATRMQVRLRTAAELLRMGLPLMPSFAFLFLLMQSNKYILEWYSSLSDVGVYSIGFNFGSVMSIVTGAIGAAWYPFLMSYMERQTEVRALFGRIVTYYVFGIGFLCLVFFIAARPVMILLTRDVYYGGASVVGFVALAYFFQVAFSFFTVGLYFKKEVTYVSLVQAIAAVAALVANYVLIRMYGVLGAGIGLAFGAFALTALMYGWNLLNAARYPRIDYEWRRIGLFAAGAAAIASLNAAVVVDGLAFELVKTSIAGTIGLGLVLLCLNAQERAMLVSVWPGRERAGSSASIVESSRAENRRDV